MSIILTYFILFSEIDLVNEGNKWLWLKTRTSSQGYFSPPQIKKWWFEWIEGVIFLFDFNFSVHQCDIITLFDGSPLTTLVGDANYFVSYLFMLFHVIFFISIHRPFNVGQWEFCPTLCNIGHNFSYLSCIRLTLDTNECERRMWIKLHKRDSFAFKAH